MNVESKPAVIDLEAMLSPISEEKPAGEPMRYSGLYDEISEARRADEDVEQGDWKVALKVADFRKVVDLAVPALTSDTKESCSMLTAFTIMVTPMPTAIRASKAMAILFLSAL